MTSGCLTECDSAVTLGRATGTRIPLGLLLLAIRAGLRLPQVLPALGAQSWSHRGSEGPRSPCDRYYRSLYRGLNE